MNPVKQIGRYQFPLLSVIAIRRRRGWRLWLINWLVEKLDLEHESDAYDVMLSNGQVLRFTEAEKEQYDTEREWHELTLEWLGAARGMGLRMG